MSTTSTIFPSQIDPDIFKIAVIIFIIAMVMFFLLTILRKTLDHKLKSKIIDRAVSEDLASSILRNGPGSDKQGNLKWFSILTGIGVGLFIVNYTLPLGVHSFATMAISIAMSFLFYQLYLQKSSFN